MISQALPYLTQRGEHHAMTNDSPRLAERFALAFPKNGAITDAAIAKACGRTAQAVSGWRKTGRIAKPHLAILANLSGRPLEWWLGADEAQADEDIAKTPREGILLTLFRALTDQEQRDLLRKLRAQFDALAVTKRVTGNGAIQTAADTKVEEAFGLPRAKVPKAQAKQLGPTGGDRDPGAADSDKLRDQ